MENTQPILHLMPKQERGVIRIAGSEAREMLQGLVTNDVKNLPPHAGLYTCLLTPQGKFQFDFFVYGQEDGLLLEGEGGARLADLLKHLKLFRLRREVTLTDVTDAFRVAWIPPHQMTQALGGASSFPGSFFLQDPRLKEMGGRALIQGVDVPRLLPPQGNETDGEGVAYLGHRIAWGVPEGSRDLTPGRSIPLEYNLDFLKAFDWNKGCYLGQELMARVKHRGLVRKRCLAYVFETPPPSLEIPGGTPLVAVGEEGLEVEVGQVQSSYGADVGGGFAIVRLERMQSQKHDSLTILKRPVKLIIPSWMPAAALAVPEIG